MIMRRFATSLPLLALIAFGCERVTVPKTPTITLANRYLSAEVLLPDPVNGVYRGPRFDWSATVGEVKTGGHTFFGPWRPEAPAKLKPTGHDATARGLAEEFSHTNPPGFAEADLNGPFVKIGVGRLLRTETNPTTRDSTLPWNKLFAEPYHFPRAYPIVDGGEWSTRRGRDWVETIHTLRREDESHAHPSTSPSRVGDMGRPASTPADTIAYRYAKRVSLDAKSATIVVRHALYNDGPASLRVDHYCHNFMNADAGQIGPDYTLSLPYEAVFLKPEKVSKLFETPGPRVTFNAPIAAGKSAEGELFLPPNLPAGECFTLHHAPTRTAIRVTSDQPVVAFNLFCTSMAICPEPYAIIDVPPHGKKTWVTRYEFLNE